MYAVKPWGMDIVRATGCALCLLATLLFVPGAAASDNKSTAPSVQAYDAIGQEMAEIISQQDSERMIKLVNFKALLYLAAKTAFSQERDIHAFVDQSMAMGEAHLCNLLFQQIFQRADQAKFIRTINGNQPVVRLTYIGEGGYEYLILTVRKNSDGSLQVADILPLTSGQNISESIGAASQMLLNPSESVIKRLFGEVEYNKELGETFKKVTKMRTAGNYRAAYDLLQAQPENVKTRKLILQLSIGFAMQIGEPEYRAQLAMLDKYYGNEAASSFMLIDHHIYNENFDKAQKSIDRIVALLGEDSALMTMKASTCLLSGNHACAEQYARKAIAIEPDIENGYWTLVTISLNAKKYKDVVATLKTLETHFGYEFTKEAFADQELYQDFIVSPEFKRWL